MKNIFSLHNDEKFPSASNYEEVKGIKIDSQKLTKINSNSQTVKESIANVAVVPKVDTEIQCENQIFKAKRNIQWEKEIRERHKRNDR